jgi:ubiquinone/menaquinone biosynthesis C-methylase UbiE
MAEHVCPWWLGYFLASPIRKMWSDDPVRLIGPYIRKGMTVLEPGPGMGFFTLALARMVGPSGRVVAVDIQSKMLSSLKRRAQKAGLSGQIDTRLAQPDSMGLADLNGAVDFAFAFAVVHEMPSAAKFFSEAAAALKPGATLFFAEPAGHVTLETFQSELDAAQNSGLFAKDRPPVRRSLAAVLRKS